jgi:hypothetical protein
MCGSSSLAELYFAQGVETFVTAQKKIADRGPSKTSIAELNEGLFDLERAADLGLKRAAEQAEAVRRVIGATASP